MRRRHLSPMVLTVALVALLFVAVQMSIQRRAARRQGLAACIAAGNAEDVCTRASEENHDTCFNLTFDSGSRYHQGAGLDQREYLTCILAGGESYRTESTQKARERREQQAKRRSEVIK